MVKLLTALFGTFFIFTSIAFAGVNYVSQSRARAGYFTVVDVAPVPTAEGQLGGLLLCDSSQSKLTVLSPNFDTAFSVEIGHRPLAAAAFRKPGSDSLFLTAVSFDEFSPSLHVVSMLGKHSTVISYSARAERPLGKLLSRETSLSIYDSAGYPAAVILRVREVIEEHLVTQGILTEVHARTYIFSLETREFTRDAAFDVAAIGDFDGDREGDLAGSFSRWSRWGTPQYPEAPPRTDLEFDIITRHEVIVKGRRESSRIRDLALMNISPFVGYDELVIAGTGGDPLAEHAGDRDYLACYSYDFDGMQELWFQREENITAVVPFLFHWQLATLRNHDRIIFFEAQTGLAADSVILRRPMYHVRFLPVANDARSLFVTGRVADTLITVRIDRENIRSDKSERPDTQLPVTFDLEQNYPNPFNGSTQLRFSNKLGQHLSLRIYNVLGQEVVTIVDNFLPPGDFDYEWDATNNFGEIQGSGIYFAQLKSTAESHIIKLIYLK